VIVGPEKRAALERAERLDSMDAPIKAFLGEATVHWAE
jgi:6-phosphogluconolactonase